MPVGGHGRYKILVQLVLAAFWARKSQVRASTAFLHGRYKILDQLVLAAFWARKSPVRASTAFFLLQPAEPGVTDADRSASLARHEREVLRADPGLRVLRVGPRAGS